MILTEDETRSLLEPYHRQLLRWHEEGYKDRRHTMTTVPDQWAAQDGIVWGGWTRNLILARADVDHSDTCYRDREGKVDVVRVHDADGRLAAQLRFRRVEMHTRWAGAAAQPRIPTPSTDAAKDWFGNKHLRDPRQIRLFEDDSHVRRYTNLLIGRTEDELLGEFERLFVVCYTGSHVAWHYEVGLPEAGVRPLAPDMPADGPTPRAKAQQLDIRRKQEPS